MLIITLIILGIAQVSRREQRVSTDNHLATQAYYAAESAVNDVQEVVKGLDADEIVSKTDCGPDSNYDKSPVLSAAFKVSYPCLLVNTDLHDYKITVGSTSSIAPLLSTSGNIQRLVVDWGRATEPLGNTKFDNCPTSNNYFPQATNWNCTFGVVRLEIVRTDGVILRDQIRNEARTFFLVPRKNGAMDATINYSQDGATVGTRCMTTEHGQPEDRCRVIIDNLNPGQNYYVRVTSLYAQPTPVTLTPTRPNGSSLDLIGQIEVDATGKAQDVLRRIKVRLTVDSKLTTQYSDYAVETSMGICKRYMVAPNYFAQGNITQPDPGNSLCNP
jgi:hypothetical protein